MFNKVFSNKGFDVQKAENKLEEYNNKSITDSTFVKVFNDLENPKNLKNKVEFNEEFESIKIT